MTVAHQRTCGSCNLCCTLLPVRSLNKGAGERCKHQRFSSKGDCCKVYANLMRVSPECRIWNCRWLVDDAGNTGRPDRVGYVIDVMPDYIKTQDDETGEINEVPVVQIWIDPKYPDAHQDPALRAWLDRTKQIALIRYSGEDAMVLFPPSRMKTREWMERGSINDRERSHSVADIFRVLGESA